MDTSSQSLDISDVGVAAQDAVNQLSTNITYAKLGLFMSRRMIQPIQTIFILLLIIITTYYCDCAYKKTLRFISWIFTIILMGFVTFMYIYNPWEQYTDPALIILEEADKLGIPVDLLLDFIQESTNTISEVIKEHTPQKGQYVI